MAAQIKLNQDKNLDVEKVLQYENQIKEIIKKYLGEGENLKSAFELDAESAGKYAAEVAKLFFDENHKKEYRAVAPGDYDYIFVANKEFLAVFERILVYGIIPAEIYNQKDDAGRSIVDMCRSLHKAEPWHEIAEKIYKLVSNNIGIEKDGYLNKEKLTKFLSVDGKLSAENILHYLSPIYNESAKIESSIVERLDYKDFYGSSKLFAEMFTRFQGKKFEKLIDAGFDENLSEEERNVAHKNVQANCMFYKNPEKMDYVLEKYKEKGKVNIFFEDERLFRSMINQDAGDLAFKYSEGLERTKELLSKSDFSKSDFFSTKKVFYLAEKYKRVPEYFGETGLQTIFVNCLNEYNKTMFSDKSKFNDVDPESIFKLAKKYNIEDKLFTDVDATLKALAFRGISKNDKDPLIKLAGTGEPLVNKESENLQIKFAKMLVARKKDENPEFLKEIVDNIGFFARKNMVETTKIMLEAVLKNIDKVEPEKLSAIARDLTAVAGNRDFENARKGIQNYIVSKNIQKQDSLDNLFGQIAFVAIDKLKLGGENVPAELQKLAERVNPQLVQTKVKSGNAFTRWATEKFNKLFGNKANQIDKN